MLERAMLVTPEREALDLLVRAQQGDAAARQALEELPNRDEIMGGLIAAFMAAPVSDPEFERSEGQSPATEVMQ